MLGGLLEMVRGLRERGVPLERALAVLTANPADLFRLRGKGRLEIGADADVLVLDRSLRTRHLCAGGRWLVRDGNPTIFGLFER